MIRGVIFDLDGVLVTTDELHYQSWKVVADAEGIYFDHKINDRLRGVSRMTSLEIVLERAARPYTPGEKVALAARKNDIYQGLCQKLTPADLLPGVASTLTELRRRGLKTAIGSASKNTRLIAAQLRLEPWFDAIVDGNDIQHSKPDPQVFLLSAQRLGLPPADCLVIEDAVAGVEAAVRAGMAVFGIGTPDKLPNAKRLAPNLSAVTVDELLNCG
jgi:beta-phosphoglucomutase